MPGAVVSSMTMSRSSWWSRVQSFWLSSNLPPVLLTVGVGAIQVIGTTFAGEEQPARESLDVLGYLLLLVGPIALLARKRHPVAVLATALATTVLYIGLGYPYGPVFLSVVVALFTTVLDGHRLAAWLLGLAGYLGIVLVEALNSTGPDVSVGEALGDAAWLVVVLVVAEVVRARSERIREAEHAQQEEELRRLGDERLRMAQEVHDVVAHGISLINVQAGTALHLMDQQPEQARTALTAIRDVSNQALTELRSVLDVLRGPDQGAPRQPAPSVTRIDDLVAGARATGLTVDVAVEGNPPPLPAAIDLAAYRIVQEALTNTVRHAGASAVSIRVTYGPGTVTIQVDDDGVGSPASVPVSGGSGIAGMRERALARGGELVAGPQPGGGFRVRACLPVARERMIRVLLADDQALVRAGFRALLDAEEDLEVVGEAEDGRRAVEETRRLVPDVVLMDIRMPGTDGLAATREIAADEHLAGVRVVILSTFDLDEYVFEALRLGASGFLVKSTEPVELLRGVRAVADGDALLSPGVTRRLVAEFAKRSTAPQAATALAELTDREREVMALVAEGLTNDEIAERLFVSPATAKTHVSRAMIKLGARDRAQLVVLAYESGLVKPGWST